MKKFIIDYFTKSGRKDWQTLWAADAEDAKEIFLTIHQGFYSECTIISVAERR